jgi:hypothetical protein
MAKSLCVLNDGDFPRHRVHKHKRLGSDAKERIPPGKFIRTVTVKHYRTVSCFMVVKRKSSSCDICFLNMV